MVTRVFIYLLFRVRIKNIYIFCQILCQETPPIPTVPLEMEVYPTMPVTIEIPPISLQSSRTAQWGSKSVECEGKGVTTQHASCTYSHLQPYFQGRR